MPRPVAAQGDEEVLRVYRRLFLVLVAVLAEMA